MVIPQFTAEASYYRGALTYAMRPNGYVAREWIMPAQEELTSSCGACVCPPGLCCKKGLFSCSCKVCGAPDDDDELMGSRTPSFLTG
jgi:hypothetical protein